jgi:hypothetical protein
MKYCDVIYAWCSDMQTHANISKLFASFLYMSLQNHVIRHTEQALQKENSKRIMLYTTFTYHYSRKWDMCMCVSVHSYSCMYVCMYIYIYIYIHVCVCSLHDEINMICIHDLYSFQSNYTHTHRVCRAASKCLLVMHAYTEHLMRTLGHAVPWQSSLWSTPKHKIL